MGNGNAMTDVVKMVWELYSGFFEKTHDQDLAVKLTNVVIESMFTSMIPSKPDHKKQVLDQLADLLS